MDKTNEKVILRKVIGLPTATALLIGSIIGSGIFVSPTAVVRETQSVGASLIIWLACGIYSALVGWTAAELGTMFKESGAYYVYFRTGIAPSVAFVFVWTSTVLIDWSAQAALCMVCSKYLLSVALSDGCRPPWILTKMIPILLLVAVLAVNVYSSKLANRVQAVCTLGKMIALVVILVGGFYRLATGHVENFQNSFAGTITNPGQLAIAFYSTLFAYGGCNALTNVTEEIDNPNRVVPRAIFIGMAVVICTYLTVNVSYFTVMDAATMIASDAAAVTWAETVIPGFTWFISISVAVSTFGTAVAASLNMPKVTFSASRHGELPGILGMIHTEFRTPLPVYIYGIIVSSIMVFATEIFTLVSALGFVGIVWHGLSSATLLILRWKRPEMPRVIKVPIVVPAAVVAMSIFLTTISIIMSHDRLLYVYALAFMSVSLPVYFIFVFKGIHIPGIDWITARLQIALNVVPSEDEYAKPHRHEVVDSIDSKTGDLNNLKIKTDDGDKTNTNVTLRNVNSRTGESTQF